MGLSHRRFDLAAKQQVEALFQPLDALEIE
jgi:hypothetical protein